MDNTTRWVQEIDYFINNTRKQIVNSQPILLLQKLSSSVQDSLAKANEVAEEVVSSMRTVRSFANESDEVKRYDIKLQVTKKLKMKEAFAYAGYIWSNEVHSEYIYQLFYLI